MTTLKKNFSIAKLYSDLEKYEANLTGIKDSRLKKQASGTSLHQRPNSTAHKNYETRDNFTTSNFTRYDKPKLEMGARFKNPRPSYENSHYEQKSSFAFDRNEYEGFTSHKSSILRENFLENSEHKDTKPQSPKVSFNKNDELYFLNECNKLYKIDGKENPRTLTAQEEADSVKVLLNEINKRDKVYDAVIGKLGAENAEEKLLSFFEKYDRMAQIVTEFKKMSKLNIEDDQQLLEFLQSEEQQKSARQAQE